MWSKIKEIFENRHELKRNLKWLLHISAPHKRALCVLLVINTIITVAGVSMAAINKHIVDAATDKTLMLPYIVLAVILAAFSLATSTFVNIFTVKVTEKYSFHIMSEMYKRILSGFWKDRTAYHSESLLTRMTSDASAVTSGVIGVASQIITTLVQLILAFLLIWHYDSSLALVALLSGPVAAFVSLFVGVKLKKIQENIQQTEADYREFLQEHISHADVIKIFGQEVSSTEKLAVLQSKRFFWIKKKNALSVMSAAIIGLVFSGTYLFAFITGAVKIASGEITYGTMTAFLSLMGQVQAPMLALAGLVPQCVGILASSGRILEIYSMRNEKLEENLPENKGTTYGIKVRNLVLSYDGKSVINGFNMDVKPGTTAMLAGDSGIGKTTLIRGLLGFLEPDGGSIALYDNEGNTTNCGCSTRPLISYVPQGNTLFSGTVADNLRVGKADATEEEMRHALELACALDFVEQLPDGLESLIGERGYGISEGQAQRIAIARAFLKPFEVLILDEATSALDVKTEQVILENLQKIKKGKTCLFVSHRKSVSEYADCVVELYNEKQ